MELYFISLDCVHGKLYLKITIFLAVVDLRSFSGKTEDTFCVGSDLGIISVCQIQHSMSLLFFLKTRTHPSTPGF